MDLRIEKTYRALIRAFTELLEEHRYEDITVAMLCERAMIRRTTFYKHFSDKADFFTFYINNLRIGLLAQAEEEMEDVQDERAPSGTTSAERAKEESYAVLKGLLDFLLEHETIVDNIITSSMMGTMLTSIVDSMAEALIARYGAIGSLQEGNPASLEEVSEFAAGGIVRLFQAWWMGGHDKEGEQHLLDTSSHLLYSVMCS